VARGLAARPSPRPLYLALSWQVTLKGVYIGRMEFVLFVKDSPHAAENFRLLCTGARAGWADGLANSRWRRRADVCLTFSLGCLAPAAAAQARRARRLRATRARASLTRSRRVGPAGRACGCGLALPSSRPALLSHTLPGARRALLSHTLSGARRALLSHTLPGARRALLSHTLPGARRALLSPRPPSRCWPCRTPLPAGRLLLPHHRCGSGPRRDSHGQSRQRTRTRRSRPSLPPLAGLRACSLRPTRPPPRLLSPGPRPQAFIDQTGAATGSPLGGAFRDDRGGLALKHDRPGLLSMANTGPNTNGEPRL
jgi:hypothetical protein